MSCETLCAVECIETEDPIDSGCEDFAVTIPELPLDFEEIEIPDASTVTEESVTGNGIFDIYMRAGMNQLMTQYDEDRIKGAEFAAAYTAMVQLMMTEANKFALGIVQAEIAAKLFPMQYLGASYDAALKEAQAKKMKFESDLVCQQVEELKANGAEERALKQAQKQVQIKQAELYNQQITSFREKTNIDAAKVSLDAWAVQAVEEPDSTWALALFKDAAGTSMRAMTQKMLNLSNQ